MPRYAPGAEVREVIADSLHAAMLNIMEPSVMHIAPINTLGCFLLKYLTRDNYVPVAGSVEVRCGGAPFGLQAHVENIDIHAYYVWIECNRGPGGIELVDFGTRYWQAWAADEGVLWSAPPPPRFLWQGKDTVDSVAGFEANYEITVALQKAVQDAVTAQKPDATVLRWESAINDAIERMLDSQAGLQFLLDVGLAKPVDEEEPFQ